MRPSAANRYRPQRPALNSVFRDRTPFLMAFLVLAGIVFVGRLFQLQIIKHDQYKAAATSEQLKKFSIPAERGTISVLDGERSLPVVLNETRYLLYADPSFVDDPEKAATQLQPVIGGKVDELKEKLSEETRYIELAKKVDKPTADKIRDLSIKGVVLKEQRQRTYPEGQFAAQVLGFVNYDGEGQYGIEGFMDKELGGTAGQLRAVTDISGVPLAGNSDNVVKDPVAGKNVTLTLDMTVQRIVEDTVKKHVESTRSKSGSAVVMDINSGAVKGMANWPTYNPADFENVSDLNLFKNRAVTDPMEVGSIMKTLTISSALDQGLINRESIYSDPGYEDVDGLKITNALNFGAGTFSIFDIIKNSMNTGAVHLLKMMGGGSDLNQQARVTWHDYMTDHYQLGKKTGIEQIGEGEGIIPDPLEGDGLNIQYANTSFGQGMTATILQIAAALSSVLNGGTYYQPHLVHSETDGAGKETVLPPKIVREKVVSSSASADITALMERYAKENNREAARPGFSVGGKTGTAQIPSPNGGYRDDAYNGTYAGFVGGQNPEYVVIIRMDEPKNGGFAGSAAARPVFTDIANVMMDSLPFTPGD